ncbi:MAG TPA: CHAT domain-containing protein [Steroidobacteraceae bacterium]|nr:CHAT domain-containing protein [Steroidobacteraceae bacterium]
MCRARLLGPVLLLTASLPLLGAEPCVPRGKTLATLEFAVDRASRVERVLSIPAGARVLVEVSESGNNLRVELVDGGPPRLADDALRRWAPQRLLIAPGARRAVTLAVIGQERTPGRAAVRAFALAHDEDRRCIDYWEKAAAADADFSRGELLSEAKIPGEPGSVDRAYAAAVAGYARAADAARPLGGLLAAQARLTQAAAEIIGVGAWDEAAASALDAEQRFTALGHDYGRDRARFFWARTQIYLARRATGRAEQERQLEVAHDTFIAVSDSHRRRGEAYDAAFALTWAGFAHGRADRYPESIADYQRALEAFASLDEPARKVQLRQNIANAQFEIGRFNEALANYSAALQAADPEEEVEIYQAIVANVAFTEYRLGKHDAALGHYSQALDLARRMQSRDNESRALHGLGVTYQAVGNLREATNYLERALALRRAEPDTAAQSATLRALADVARDAGRLREALARHQEALGVGVQSPLQAARIRLEIARDQADLGDYAAAETLLAELLGTGSDDPIVRAGAEAVAARVSLAQGRLEAAARDAQSSTNYFAAQQLLQGEFGGLMLQARIACARGDRATALEFSGQAMRRAEAIRISSNNPALRASLWRPLRPAFDFSIGVLAGSTPCGRGAPDPEAALAIAEASRNRALDDFRRRLPPASARADTRRRELFEKLAERRAQIEALADRVAADDPRLRLVREDISTLTRDIDLAGGDGALPRVDTADLQRTLRGDRREMPADSAAIEYWLGEERTFAWVITRHRVRFFDLGPTPAIDSAARALHAASSAWTQVALPERLQRARALNALILAPLQRDLAHARTLYFIPDGALHTVPFAALASGTDAAPRFLIDTHDVAVSPMLRALSGPPARATVAGPALVVADPVYSRQDSRFADRRTGPAFVESPTVADRTLRGAHSWKRLSASGREAADIARLLGADSVELLSGFDASRVNVLNRGLGKYRIIHFAAHAVADTEAPQLSALILSTVGADGQPRVGELFAGDLLSERLNAELVVLSGCDTALGQTSAGEGLLGLRYAAHAAGADSVVASLWPVMDAAGAQLMRDLYTGIVRERLSTVAALSRAMRDARRQWADPALWGAFDVSSGPGS